MNDGCDVVLQENLVERRLVVYGSFHKYQVALVTFGQSSHSLHGFLVGIAKIVDNDHLESRLEKSQRRM